MKDAEELDLPQHVPLRVRVWWRLWQNFEIVLIVWLVVLLVLVPFLLSMVFL